MKKDLLKGFGLNAIKEIAVQIYDISRTQSLGESLNIKGSSGDITKFADDFSEKIIKEIIEKYILDKPQIKIILISEETGLVEFGNLNSKDGFFIILDPLDGSNNIRAWRTPAPSIGIGIAMGSLERLEKFDNFEAIEVTMAMDIFNQRVYTTAINEPSRVENFGTINTSPVRKIGDAIIGCSFYHQGPDFDKFWEDQKEIMRSIKSVRRLGSLILDFCKVASGEYDAYVTLLGRTGFYDLASVKMLIENAGGVVEIISGKTEFCIIKRIIETRDSTLLEKYRYRVLVSANNEIHKQIKMNIKT